MAVRVLLVIAGALLVVWAVSSALRTVILPRVTRGLLDRAVFRSLRVVFRLVSQVRSSFAWKDRVMAFFAPVGLLGLVATWLILATAGFTLVFWGLRDTGWAEAFLLSGSSLFTLGFASVEGAPLQALVFTEAALGLGLLALLITYLPAMYGAFSRRETPVALLEVRAGTPPSAAAMIERFSRIAWLDRLATVWEEWEVWFADLEESHTSYPALAFYRSPQPDRHWVTAAGTVLDAAALSLSTIAMPAQPQAALMIRAGFISLRRIADFFGVAGPEPVPDGPISITREEFEATLDHLAAAGVPLKPDRDLAWRAFSGWRVNYDTALLALAEITTAPYAPWTADRSPLGHPDVRMRRWGGRRRTA